MRPCEKISRLMMFFISERHEVKRKWKRVELVALKSECTDASLKRESTKHNISTLFELLRRRGRFSRKRKS